MSKRDSIDRLNKLLELPSTGLEQDWDVELANPERIAEFTNIYGTLTVADDRFFLMTLIIASVDQFLQRTGQLPQEWSRITTLIRTDTPIHNPTIEYWCQATEEDPDSWFAVTPHLRDAIAHE